MKSKGESEGEHVFSFKQFIKIETVYLFWDLQHEKTRLFLLFLNYEKNLATSNFFGGNGKFKFFHTDQNLF